MIGQIRAVYIGHICTQHERRLLFTWNLLQQASLTDGQLNGIRISFHQRLYGGLKVLDALQKTMLVEKTVIHRYIKAAA